MAILFKILANIKLKHWLIIALVLTILLSLFLWNRLQHQKFETKRQKQNYTELRDLSDKKIATLTLSSKTELKDYINSNSDLKTLLEKQQKEHRIKLKQLNKIIYQQQIYIDTTATDQNVTEIVKYIKQDIPFEKEWTDSTACLLLKGKLIYNNDSLKNKIVYKKFTNEMLLTGHWQRPQKNWFTRNFGKRYATSTVTNSCGESKTIVINKK